MNELKLQVVVDPEIDRKVKGVVAFGDFITDSPENTVIYGPGDAPRFYTELVMGRPFPFILVTRDIQMLGVQASIALFLYRDLALLPSVAPFVTVATMADVLGTAGHALMERDLSRFLMFLNGSAKLVRSKQEREETLTRSVSLIRDYLTEGRLPALPPEPEPPRVVDVGTDGFVFAVSSHENLAHGWEELFRMGFLRGLLVQSRGERTRVLAVRKSHFLAFDLKRAAEALNQAEAAMGEPESWDSNGLWLAHSDEGTLIPPTALLEILRRV